ncbi:hypothetical protein ACTFIZ_002286 [Dictyostelium cf. discoideum]
MSTTVNNNEASSSSTSASNNAESLDLRMKSMEDQINNLSLALTRFMKESMFSSNTASRSQPSHDNSDTESEQSDNETSNDVDVPTEYQLYDTLLGQYKHMVNNQGLLVEEESPFGTPDGISVSSNVKNNDTDLLIVEKRINDSLKPLLLMSSMLSPDNHNVDLELIRYLAESAIVLAVNAQASHSREIYGSEVLLPIKIKDTPKMFDETETERVRKLAKSIRKNNEAKQSLLKMNNHSKSNSQERKQSHQNLVVPVVINPIEHVFKSSGNACTVNGVSITMSETEQLQAKDSNRQHNHSLIHQSPGWSDTRTISSVRTTLETMPQEESQLDWGAYSRILQCKSRPPKPSFRDESQIIQSNQELQLATEERSVQQHPTSIRSNPDGSIRISPEPSNDQLLNNQNECTPPRLESMETMSGVPSTNTFAFYPGENELVQFEEGFYNTDLSNLEISNMVSDDSSTSSSSSTSHVSSSSVYIPRSIDQTISRVNTNSNSTTLETGDYSTFQSHVNSIFGTQNSGTSELLMKSWEQSTLKVYNSSYTRFLNFCTLNSLDPSNITLVVFMDYLTHLFKIKPPLAFSTINNHRSMLNQLLLLKNQTDIVNDPFITRIMTGIHKLRPSSAKYKEIWDANKVFKYLSTIKVLPKFTYTALLNKTLVLCKMFGLARSSDLVKWSFKGLNITTDSIRGPVINAKEQRKDGVLSMLELTSLDDTYSQVCPVRHLTTYLKSTNERRKKHQSDSVFINNDGTPLQVNQINEVVLSTLSKSGIDTTKFKSHSTRSAMASQLLSNNVPFHVVKKMGRWKSNDTVDTFYDKRIIGEKSGGFLNNNIR